MGWRALDISGCVCIRAGGLEMLSAVVAVSQPLLELVVTVMGTLYLWGYRPKPYSAPAIAPPSTAPASKSGDPSIVLSPSPNAANRRPAALLLRLIEDPPAKKVALYGLRRETGRTIPPQLLRCAGNSNSEFRAGRSKLSWTVGMLRSGGRFNSVSEVVATWAGHLDLLLKMDVGGALHFDGILSGS
jgi:hypothetical protein